MASRENRLVKYWLAPLILVVVLAAMAGMTAAVQNSWWVDRDRPVSVDQRADDGSTMLTPVGIDYASATGVLVIRIGEDAVPVEVLVTTDAGRITRLEITPWGALSYREFVALLEARAENVGWEPDEFQRLADDLTASQRSGQGDNYSAAPADGTAIGASVSATVTVGRD